MSDDSKKPAPDAAPADVPAGVPRPSAAGGVLRIALPALLAAAAAYGGTRFAGTHVAHAAAPPADAHHAAEIHPPGPTLPLEPFLVTVFDANHKPHPMKMTIAVEFDSHTKDDLKTFVPRIRDTILAHLRTLTYEHVTDAALIEKVRTELVERCKAAGAKGAERVLVTDFVVQ